MSGTVSEVMGPDLDCTHQNAADERDLQGCGKDMEDHRSQQKADTLGSSVNCPRQSSRLSCQVKA
jgi:hypothetical protein